jgi:hypothetical protein
VIFESVDTRLPIREPLPFDSVECPNRPLLVVNAKRNARVVPEIELRQIPVQMLFGAMLVDAMHAALKDAEHAFDGVRVGIAAHVFVGTVVDRLVVRELGTDLRIEAAFVGIENRLAMHVRRDDGRHVVDTGALDVEAANLATTLDKGDNGALAGRTATGL